MKRIVLLLLASGIVAVEARTIELRFPNLKQPVVVSFPENHQPGRTFPGVLYYHGTNGTVDTGRMREHTGPDDWFVVGMTYVQTGKFTFTPETLDEERLVLRSVIRHLSAGHGLDPRRVYVAGFSKGGWISGLLLQRERTLAGAAILGAGHIHRIEERPARFPGPAEVFIGVGRKDGNYPFALRAVTFFRGLGAGTKLETWHDRRHQFPPDGSPALRQLFALRAGGNTATGEMATAWASDRLAGIAAMRDPVARWVAHLDAEQAPYFDLLPESQQAAFKARRAELENTAAVQPEVKLLATHRRILREEIGDHSKENYERLQKAYRSLADSGEGTRQGAIARHDQERITRLLKHFDEQERLRREELEPFGPEPTEELFSPPAPDPRPIIPRNPLVK